jgi:hypothetical protein
VEQESCISLTHSKCWNPNAELKTPREQGIGLGQITRAYTQTGTVRFDALSEIRHLHPELRELNWDNVRSRPDLQIRAIILKSKDNFTHYTKYRVNEENSLIFGIVSYNGGIGGLDNERRACVLTKNCDPNIWFGNVELLCLKSKAALYGNRSACDINREYPINIINIRSNKYQKFWVTQ